MNTLIAQRETSKLERAIKKASRVLLELEVAQSKWEAKKGMGSVYSSVDALMRDVSREA